jgi:spermidine synthase
LREFRERLHGGIYQTFEIDRVLHDGKTDFQSVLIFETRAVGRVLVLDGIVQSTEADEFIYHEMLVHVALMAHGAPRRVLIVGGGDGGALEEVLKHPVEAVTIVEIDPGVVELCREHLSSISKGAFEDPRTKLVIGDGVEFAANFRAEYDVIIVDSTDPVGAQSVPLFEAPFYESCRVALTAGGVMVAQMGVPFFQGAELAAASKALGGVFTHSGIFAAAVPTYAGGVMAFGWGSEAVDAANPAMHATAKYAALGDLRYYTLEVHRAAFALPKYVQGLAGGPPRS